MPRLTPRQSKYIVVLIVSAPWLTVLGAASFLAFAYVRQARSDDACRLATVRAADR